MPAQFSRHTAGITTETFGADVIVHDETTNQVHHLTGDTAAAWTAPETTSSAKAIARVAEHRVRSVPGYPALKSLDVTSWSVVNGDLTVNFTFDFSAVPNAANYTVSAFSLAPLELHPVGRAVNDSYVITNNAQIATNVPVGQTVPITTIVHGTAIVPNARCYLASPRSPEPLPADAASSARHRTT